MPRYVDKHLIGGGGFGEVWLCEREDGAVFAKKKLNLTDETSIERFAREVRILSKLDHPNIVKVIARHLESPPYWYAMPHYKGSLYDEYPGIIKDHPRALKVFSAILDGIEYAHGEGVIHRDLKPENILLNGDTDVAISDFGLGRFIDSRSTRQTHTGQGFGSILYMAPEQLADAKRADVRSDVFGLGRLLCELYTEPLSVAPPDLTGVAPGIAMVINRATAGRPENRYQTTSELKQAWLAVIDGTRADVEAKELAIQLASVGTAAGATDTAIRQLMPLLMRRMPTGDALHDMIMNIDPKAVRLMFHEDPAAVRRMVDDFVAFTVAVGWGFSYTDRIGVVCKALYGELEDLEARAALLECLLQVGYGHNRWFVMGLCDELLVTRRPAGEGPAIVERLRRNISSERLAELANRVTNAVDPSIRGFLAELRGT